MSNRLATAERLLLVSLRTTEHRSGELTTAYRSGGYAPGDVLYQLRSRRMTRKIKSEWRDTPGGGRVLGTTFALTNRGRAAADQLIHNAGTYRDGRHPGDPDRWLAAIARDSFRAATYRRMFGYPGEDASANSHEIYRLAERRSTRLASPPCETRTMAEARAMIERWYSAWPELGLYRASLARLVPTDREPLDRAITALAGVSFVENAHRRLRMLIAARREHDSGDEDDGAIEAAIAECERQLRAAILGDGHLHEPGALETDLRVAALAYANGWTVSAEELAP